MSTARPILTTEKSSFFARFGEGLSYFFSSFKYINDNGLWLFVFLAIIITGVAMFFFKWGLSVVLLGFVGKLFGSSGFIAWSVSTVAGWFIGSFFTLMIGAIVFGVIGAFIQSKMERITFGVEAAFSFTFLIKNIIISIIVVLEYLFFSLVVTIAAQFLHFIPLLGTLMVLIILKAYAAYWVGRVNMLSILADHYYSYGERRALVNKRFKAHCLGLGIMEIVASILPFIGDYVFFFIWALALVGCIRVYYDHYPEEARTNLNNLNMRLKGS